MQERGRTFTNVLSLLAAFVATSVVLGLLGAGLMMPTVAATGSAARAGVAVFDALPSDFTQTPLSQQSRILASDGTLIATPFDENRIIVPLAQIAPVMRQAQIAIEDSRFYEHGGVDPQGVGRAFISNLRGGSTQGASTLTQQYVKITLQENALRNKDTKAAQAATARSYTRKLQELKYAVTLEKTLTKDQILQGYLNLVYYGDQAYGVEAAARHYFGVKASQLNLPQAATLAGLVQAPSATDPIRSPAKALARRNVVLDRMYTLNLITDKAWQSARKSKIVIHPKPAQNSCALSPYPYFCNYVKEWLLEQPALGKTRAERSRRINRGGLTIQTTLNPKIQATAQQELVAKVPPGSKMPDGSGGQTDVGAAAAVIEPGTGNVLAIAQNTTFSLKKSDGKTSVNWAVDPKYGGSGGFAFGSTAKMFAVAEALRSGMPIDSTIFARAASPTSPAIFTHGDYPPGDQCSVVPGTSWAVHNDEGTRNGALSLTDAAAFSVNTAFAGLVASLGACKVRDMMTNLGLHQGGTGKWISYSPVTHQSAGPASITLGCDSVSPLTLASSYAAIASGGIYCEPSPVLTITTNDKKLLPLPKGQCRRALSPGVANGVTQILKAVITKGTGFGNALAGGRPVAGKTGTAGNSTPAGGTNETWFVGYTPQLTTAVWVGTPDDPHNAARMENLTLGGQTYGGEIFGATIAAPIWKQIMDRASAGMPFRDFADPSAQVQSGDVVPIPNVAGMAVSDAVAALTAAAFKPVVGAAVASNVPAGQVAGTQPATQALRGTTVVILTSAGNAPTPPASAPTTGITFPTPNTRNSGGRLPKCRPGGPMPCK
jgi:Membrane carboxypeptidase (penicillin-binding protein)